MYFWLRLTRLSQNKLNNIPIQQFKGLHSKCIVGDQNRIFRYFKCSIYCRTYFRFRTMQAVFIVFGYVLRLTVFGYLSWLNTYLGIVLVIDIGDLVIFQITRAFRVCFANDVI